VPGARQKDDESVLQLKNQKEKTGAETKPGGIIMVVQSKKMSFLLQERCFFLTLAF